VRRADDPREGRGDRRERALRGGLPGRRPERLDLRQRRLVGGLGLVDRRLAHELLRGELAVALVHALRVRLRHLRKARGDALLGDARIDAGEHLPRLHAVAGLGEELRHAAVDLGADRGLAHRLDHALRGERLRQLAHAGLERLEALRACRGREDEEQRGDHRAAAPAKRGHQRVLQVLKPNGR
jgi:hypothetical protein